MCARILRFPDGAVVPQPARRKLTVSIQDWVAEESGGRKGPQLVVNARRTAAGVPDRTEVEDPTARCADANEDSTDALRERLDDGKPRTVE